MKKDNNLVTVVITTYKRNASILKNAINSVLTQTHKDLELIIVDDSPNTYEERENVKKYCNSIKDKRVTYLQQEKNFGACVARNRGLNIAKGKYISFLDDDDEYLPNRIEEMLKLFIDNSIDLVYCNASMYEDGIYKRKYSDTQMPYTGYIYDKIMATNFIGSPSMVILKTEALKRIGGFDPKLEASQDWDVWIRICKNGKVNYTDKVLFNYYADSTDKNRITNDTKRRIRALRYLNEKNSEYLNNNKKVLAIRKEYEMRLHIKDKNLKEALKSYVDVIMCRPLKILTNLILLKAFGRFIIKK